MGKEFGKKGQEEAINTKDSGWRIRKMGMESLLGQMGISIRVTMQTIYDKAMAK